MEHLWSHLPDLCLLALFKYLPMCDMIISVGRVCTNWERVQRDELSRRQVLVIVGVPVKEESASQKTIFDRLSGRENPFEIDLITLVRCDDGSPWVQLPSLEQIEFHTLRVSDDVLTERFTTALMDLMPNITHLTVKLSMHSMSPIPALEQMIRLINNYACNLISLKLDFDYSSIDIFVLLNRNLRHSIKTRFSELLGSFDQLESLQNLSMSILSFDNEYPELSILSRLSIFTFNEEALHATLPQIEPENDFRVNSIEWHSSIPLEELIRIDPQLAKKFTYVCFSKNLEANDLNDLRLFCSRFTYLTSLSLGTSSVPMTTLARHLSQLPKLVSLTMWFQYIFEEEQTPHFEITQVPSVLLLTLSISTWSHLNTERLHVDKIFPNLQVLHLLHGIDQCEECDYDNNYVIDVVLDNEPELHPRIAECMRLTRQPFRRCAKLHTVKLDICGQNLSDFLPKGLITPDQM